MKYKSYYAEVKFDEEAGVFHGEVVGTRDVITFEGESVPELNKAFKDSIEDYLAFCAERGKEADRPFSGKFVVRMNPEEHRNVYMAAQTSGLSLNSWVIHAMKEQAEKELTG